MNKNQKRGPKKKPEALKHRRVFISLSPEHVKWLEQFKKKKGESRSGKIQELISKAMKDTQ